MTSGPKNSTTPAVEALADLVDDELIARLAGQARAQGLSLVGEGGLLQQLTKRVIEAALEGEMDSHLGYGKHDRVGRDGGNSRNGTRVKTVVTEAGPVEIEVPRDRDASFTPRIVAKRQRRLSGVDDLVISLTAKGLTTGEVAAHLAEVYDVSVSKETISTITDRVLDGLSDWQNRPLEHLPGLDRAHRCPPQRPTTVLTRRRPVNEDLVRCGDLPQRESRLTGLLPRRPTRGLAPGSGRRLGRPVRRRRLRRRP